MGGTEFFLYHPLCFGRNLIVADFIMGVAFCQKNCPAAEK
jgi:hypothetical protein